MQTQILGVLLAVSLFALIGLCQWMRDNAADIRGAVQSILAPSANRNPVGSEQLGSRSGGGQLGGLIGQQLNRLPE